LSQLKPSGTYDAVEKIGKKSIRNHRVKGKRWGGESIRTELGMIDND